jgi:hypothetical protein
VSLEIGKESEHPSRHALTNYHAGELAGSEKDEILAHVAGCPACRRILEQLAEAKASFTKGHDREKFLRAVRSRSAEPETAWWQVLLRPVHLAATAAVMVMAVLVMSLWTPDDNGERMKGADLELGYYVMGPQGPEKAAQGHVLHPGDRIQFRLTAPAGGYVHIVGVDERGNLSVYFPRPDETPEAFPGGAGRPVPGSVILDEVLGRERIFVLVCREPIDRDKLVERLGSVPEGPRSLMEVDRLPLRCEQRDLVLRKE